MSSDSSRYEDRESSSQSSYRHPQRLFSMAEFLRLFLVVMQEIRGTEPLEEPDPCLLCLRWVLKCRGHMHYHTSLSAPSSESADEAQLWDNVSPDSSFLSAHLPAVLPTPPSSEAASNNATTLFCDRSVQAPSICASCNRPFPLPSWGSQESARGDGDLDFSGLGRRGASLGVPPLSQDTNSISLGATPSDELSFSSFTSMDSLSDSVRATPEGNAAGRTDGSHAVDTPHTPLAVDIPHTPLAVDIPHTPLAVDIPHTPLAVDTPCMQPAVIVAAQGVGRVTPSYNAVMMAPSASETWYIVTRGRRVGVFDNSTAMTHAMTRVSGSAGHGGFSTRKSAIEAFRSAEALGFVVQVPDV